MNFKPSGQVKFKTKPGTIANQLFVAQCMAARIGEMVAFACTQPMKTLPTSAQVIRSEIFKNQELVNNSYLREYLDLEKLDIETQGFEQVLTNVLPAREYDIALKSIFGSGERATKENVLSALEAYLQDLYQVTEGLLADR